MAVEIERKFLPADEGWRAMVTSSTRMRQAYLLRGDGAALRVRISEPEQGEAVAHLNLKVGDLTVQRLEFEYPVPLQDAEAMIEARGAQGADRVIDKTRHEVPGDGVTFEIDEFHGEDEGLVVIEVELADAEQAFQRPGWIGREVSEERRYYNVSLIDRPYSSWSEDER